MELSDQLAADLAALADGRLDAARRAEVEARVAADPELAAALERQHTAVRAVTAAAAETWAPHDLRLRIDALGRAPARRPRRRLFGLLGAAGAAAAAAVAVVIGLGGGLDVNATLAAAIRPPLATVTLDPTRPALLREEVEGVRFPNFEKKFGWRAAGVRTDEIEGRATETVFYEKGGRRIAYTIVAGEAIDPPGDAARLRSGGVALRGTAAGKRQVVTWERRGHTCVLSGIAVPRSELVGLAAWKAKGAVAF